MTDFGIKTSFRGVNFQQHPIDIDNGDFQLAIRAWGAGNPHPQFSFDTDLRSSTRPSPASATPACPA
ncbi:MAG: hypothetical protein R3A10_09125 [Caldilineaceae bacterium]